MTKKTEGTGIPNLNFNALKPENDNPFKLDFSNLNKQNKQEQGNFCFKFQ